MADIEYTEGVDLQDMDMAQDGSRVGKIINILGAGASLILVVGVGIWGYKLLVRDVSGVPVVRAVQGPLRVQPENPGGRPADHQGLAVNAVAAQGIAEAPADRLMLAPKPVDLAEEDQPMGELTELAALTAVAEADQATLQGADSGTGEGTIDALVSRLVQDAEPIEGVTLDVSAGPEVVTQAAARVVRPNDLGIELLEDPADEVEELAPELEIVTGPGVHRSLRPHLRPARADVAVATAIQAAVFATEDASQETREVAADTLPAGTRLAQLGAFDSADVARTEWDRLNGRFEDYLNGKIRVIQKASSGGRTFYRLRAMGFEDINDARRFCSVLVAEKADCIPVTTR